jgi:hypothetical protein
MYDTDTKTHSSAAYIFDTEEGGKTALVPMEPKKWYIEYPEQELIVEDAPAVKIRVDVTGLNNAEIVNLLTALNEAGFEAELTTLTELKQDYIRQGDWIPNVSPGIGIRPTNPPYTPQYPLVTYNTATAAKPENRTYFIKEADLHQIPGQMGIHELIHEDDN